jgi:hypothetical protein
MGSIFLSRFCCFLLGSLTEATMLIWDMVVFMIEYSLYRITYNSGNLTTNTHCRSVYGSSNRAVVG